MKARIRSRDGDGSHFSPRPSPYQRQSYRDANSKSKRGATQVLRRIAGLFSLNFTSSSERLLPAVSPDTKAGKVRLARQKRVKMYLSIICGLFVLIFLGFVKNFFSTTTSDSTMLKSGVTIAQNNWNHSLRSSSKNYKNEQSKIIRNKFRKVGNDVAKSAKESVVILPKKESHTEVSNPAAPAEKAPPQEDPSQDKEVSNDPSTALTTDETLLPTPNDEILPSNNNRYRQGEPSKQVIRAFKDTWKTYRDHAWGTDMLRPISRSGTSQHNFNMGLMIVDSVDTMILMGNALNGEVREALEWVITNLEPKMNSAGSVNLFECTIRVLGGLLGSVTVLGDHFYLHQHAGGGTLASTSPETPHRNKFALFSSTENHNNNEKPLSVSERRDYQSKLLRLADVIGGKLIKAFGTSKGVSSLAEITSVQLEFRDLARHLTLESGHDSSSNSFLGSSSLQETFFDQSSFEKYVQPVDIAEDVVVDEINRHGLDGGLGRTLFDPNSATMSGPYKLGSRGDSYYEYLLKLWLQTGKKKNVFRERYEKAIGAVLKHLLAETDDGLLYIQEKEAQEADKMDHLVCFLPGVLALGWHHGIGHHNGKKIDDLQQESEEARAARLATVFNRGYPYDHLEVAERLTHTCVVGYRDTATGMAGEIMKFRHSGGNELNRYGEPKHTSFWIDALDGHSLLRPETVESLWVLYSITGNEVYRQWGYDIFLAFKQYARDPNTGSYCSLDDVRNVNVHRRDSTESFFMAETLKYLFLLFEDPKLFSIDDIVMNTEAHPLRLLPKVKKL
eukprot:g1450.t1